GSSVGGATLTKANKVGVLGPFADTGSGSTGFSFTNAQVLATSGAISSATWPVTITTTTGGLTLGGNVTASGTLALVSAGTIGQSSGSITATTLTGSAGGTVTLNDTTNQVGNLGSFGVTGSGDFNFNDGGQTGNLTIAGPVTASTGAGSVSISG